MRYIFGDVVVDTERRELRCAESLTPLEPKAYQVLVYLLEHRDRLVTREELLEHCWPEAYVADSAVARCIVAIRRAVGDSAEMQQVIRTRRGHGYRFVAPVTASAPAPTRPCPHCAHLVQMPAAFCPACGQAVQAEETDAPPGATAPPLTVAAPPEPTPTSRPSPLSDPGGERKLLTVLCARWRSLHERIADMDLDRLYDLQQAVAALVRDAVAPYGGTLQHRTHEQVVILFGAPVAQEDHALRATLAALALQRLWPDTSDALGQSLHLTLSLQIGLSSGQVVIDASGDDPLHRMTVTGAAPALAATLAYNIAPETVVVSQETARLLPEAIRMEPLSGPVAGMSPSETLYRVLGCAEDQLAQSRQANRRSRFVGRDEELLTLRQRLERAGNGQGHIVGIVGEAGMGKSRLLAEFRQRAGALSMTYLSGRCHSYGAATPYLPLAQLLRQLWGLPETDRPLAYRTQVWHELRNLGLEPESAGPAVLDVFGISEATAAWEGGSPQERKSRTFAVLQHVFLYRQTETPLVLEVEDFHWIDPSSEEFLTSLAARLSGARLLLLTTYRPGYRPAWIASSAFTQMALPPLTPADSLSLIQDALKEFPGLDDVCRQILAKAHGNPFFLEELALTAGAPGRQPAMPDTVQVVLAARIDRLPPAAKRVLQIAAVVGTEAPQPLLAMLAVLPEEVMVESLALLQASEFLTETRVFPVVTYAFKHALTQEAAYQSLLRQTRQRYHQSIAQALAEKFPELVETQPELLARHYTLGGLEAQAVEYWLRAGEQALERSGYAEAVAHLSACREVLSVMVPAAPLHQEFRLHLTLGAALTATLGYTAPDVEQAYTRAWELGQQLPETSELVPVFAGLWRLYAARGELRQARELAERCLALARRIDEPACLLFAHMAFAITQLYLGDVVASRQHCAQGLALYDPQHHQPWAFLVPQDPGVACHAFMAQALWLLGYPDQALSMSVQGLRLAQELAYPFSLAYAMNLVTVVYQLRRDGPAAQARAEAAIAYGAEHGFEQMVVMGNILLGWALAEQGDTDAGIAMMSQGLEDSRAQGAGLGLPPVLAQVAEAYWRAGRMDEGLRLVEEALGLVAASGERWWEAELYRIKGELLRQQAEPDQAEACFFQALDIAQTQQASSLELRAAISLGRLWHEQGRRAPARALLAECYAGFSEGFDTPDLQEAQALLDALT